jgi:hypothetical protein
MELAKVTLASIKQEIAECRAEFRAIPEGKRRNGIPVGKWAKQRQTLNCRISRLETAKMLCDWFARGVQPSYLSWDHVKSYL